MLTSVIVDEELEPRDEESERPLSEFEPGVYIQSRFENLSSSTISSTATLLSPWPHFYGAVELASTPARPSIAELDSSWDSLHRPTQSTTSLSPTLFSRPSEGELSCFSTAPYFPPAQQPLSDQAGDGSLSSMTSAATLHEEYANYQAYYSSYETKGERVRSAVLPKLTMSKSEPSIARPLSIADEQRLRRRARQRLILGG